jgi:hypothetical protein
MVAPCPSAVGNPMAKSPALSGVMASEDKTFAIGTRVRFSAQGLSVSRCAALWEGTVIGRSAYVSCRRVKWDHLAVPQTIPLACLEIVELAGTVIAGPRK